MLCGSFFHVELGVNQSLVCLGIKKFIQQANFTLAYSPRQCKNTDGQPEIIISQLILMSTQRKEARSQCGKRIRVLIIPPKCSSDANTVVHVVCRREPAPFVWDVLVTN